MATCFRRQRILKISFLFKKNKKFHGQCFNFGPNDKSSKSVIDLVHEIKKIGEI